MAKHKNKQVGQQTQQVGASLTDLLKQIPAPQDNWSLLDDLSQEIKMPVCVLYVGEGCMIRPEILRPLYDALESIGKVDSLALFLRSTGGVTEVPWKIVSLLREYCQHLTVLVPEVAHSGATHITLAADKLIMTELATLSSVDPTRNHPLLPTDKDGNPAPCSVQDLKHCVEFIKGQLGDTHTGSDVATIIGQLFTHVHPLALGAVEQSAELSKLITRKVLSTRIEPLSEDQVERIVDQLAGKYFSHTFPISRWDVKNDLKLEVEEPGKQLKQKMESLLGYYEKNVKKVGEGKADGTPLAILQSVFIECKQVRQIGYAVVDSKMTHFQILWRKIERGGVNA